MSELAAKWSLSDCNDEIRAALAATAQDVIRSARAIAEGAAARNARAESLRVSLEAAARALTARSAVQSPLATLLATTALQWREEERRQGARLLQLHGQLQASSSELEVATQASLRQSTSLRNTIARADAALAQAQQTEESLASLQQEMRELIGEMSNMQSHIDEILQEVGR